MEILFQILRVISSAKELEKFLRLSKNRSPQSLSPTRKRFKSTAMQLIQKNPFDLGFFNIF